MREREGDSLERARLEREYFAEVEETCDRASAALRELEARVADGRPAAALIDSIFRDVHSMKGLSASFGFRPVADLAHALEEHLGRVRSGRAAPERDALGLIGESLDALFATVASLRPGAAPAPDMQDLRARLAAARGEEEPVARRAPEDPGASFPLDPPLRAALSRSEEERLAAAARAGRRLFLLRLRLDADRCDDQLRDTVARLGDAADVLATYPGACSAGAAATWSGDAGLEPGGDGVLIFTLLVAADREREAVRARATVPCAIAEIEKARAAPDDPAIEATTRALMGFSGSLRVPVARLDDLLAQAGDLAVAAAALRRASQPVREAHGADRGVREMDRQVGALGARVRALQRGIAEARLVPLAQVFDRMRRLVTRTAAAVGKEVDLDLTGGGTEIDKSVMDELASPLMHLMFNALDHGIESPAERARAGKPPRGRLALRAGPRGGKVAIELSDDGGGIVPGRVAEAARRAGLIPADRVLTAAEAAEIIFTPGFSTLPVAGRVSGRGMGMDVVRRTVRRLHGTIRARSSVGEGTTFTLVVPISLAAVPALIVARGGRRYAVPIAGVRGNVRLDRARMRRDPGSREVYDHSDGPLPLVDLDGGAAAREAGRYAVIAGDGDRRVGLVVDEFFGRQEIIVKEIGGLGPTPWVAGATDLGDATAVLVVDIEALLAGEAHAGAA